MSLTAPRSSPTEAGVTIGPLSQGSPDLATFGI